MACLDEARDYHVQAILGAVGLENDLSLSMLSAPGPGVI